MALSAQSYQFISQLGVCRLIDASTGPEGPHGVTSSLLVPANGWHNGHRFPHDVQVDLEAQGFDKTVQEGIEYFLVPEESTNLPGRLSHYAQATGVADLENPPGGGVNRVRETLENTAAATVDPDGVAKYVAENDSYEEARTKASQAAEVAHRAVNPDAKDAPKAAPAPKPAPKKAE